MQHVPTILLLILMVYLTSFTLAATQASQQRTRAEAWDRLLSPDREVRRAAQQELAYRRDVVAQALVDNLEQLAQRPDRTFEGAFHLSVRAVNDLRVDQATPLLLTLLEFQLNPSTFPVGARYRNSAFYPVAQALAKIGGQPVLNGIFDRLTQPSSELVIRVSAWVLKEMVGSELAVAIVSHKLDQTTSPREEQNLESLIELLRSGKPLLTYPKH